MIRPVVRNSETKSIYLHNRFSESIGGIGRDARAIEATLTKMIEEGYPFELILTDSRRLKKGKKRRDRSPSELCLVKPQIDHYFFFRRRLILIQRVHDFFPITNYGWFSLRAKVSFILGFLGCIMRNNVVYVCNSKTVEKELRRLHPKRNVRTVVIPCETVLSEVTPCGNCSGCKSKLPNRFALSVGTVEPRKNYHFLLDCWRELETAVPLIIIGKPGWKSRSTLKALRNAKNVNLIEDCCDGSLLIYYQNCEIYLSCSLNEGFNIPIGEALQFKKKVLCTKIPAHIELYANHVHYFESNNKNDFIDKVKDLLSPRVIESSYAPLRHHPRLNWKSFFIGVLHENL